MVRVKHDKPRGILNVRVADGLRRYWASEDLAPFVEHYWIVRWNVDEPQTAETLPHPSVHMVLGREESEVVGVAHFVKECVVGSVQEQDVANFFAACVAKRVLGDFWWHDEVAWCFDGLYDLAFACVKCSECLDEC